MLRVFIVHFAVFSCAFSSHAHAQPQKKNLRSATGFLGLNTIPNARMNPVGEVEIGVKMSDPYMHGFIGMQIAEPIAITLRQSAEVSSISGEADRLYPGMDVKLRLAKESAYTPEVAVGLTSAIGHKRMSGEYIALSKRYNNFDFTAGLGWGRFGSAGHFSNPLKLISNHFDQDRTYNSETANSVENWFTGDKVGIFAGVEYFLPYDGLSLKFDYGADRYSAEKDAFNYDSPAPWAIGLTYQSPYNIDASLAMLGTDKIMARLSLRGNVANWPLKSDAHAQDNPEAHKDIAIQIGERTSSKQLHARVELPANSTTPQTFAHSLRYLADYAGPNTSRFFITPSSHNLTGATASFTKSDVDKILDKERISSDEIWKNTHFTVSDDQDIENKNFFSYMWKTLDYDLTLQNDINMDGEETPLYYRSAILGSLKTHEPNGTYYGGTLRLNIHDNLNGLNDLRITSPYPVKSDIDQMTRKRVSFDNLYTGYGATFSPSIHAMYLGGYLDEFYFGQGISALYRPYNKRYALGIESWSAVRRAPSTLNLQLQGAAAFSAFLNGWYDIPSYNATLHAKVGKFLAGDVGAALAIEKEFPSGAILSGEIALSNYNELDLFGDSTHAYHRLALTLPLGGLPHVPQNTRIKTNIGPLGRDLAQSIDAPVSLYKITDKLSLKHLRENWKDITQ